jgi:hypothetical protein
MKIIITPIKGGREAHVRYAYATKISLENDDEVVNFEGQLPALAIAEAVKKKILLVYPEGK